MCLFLEEFGEMEICVVVVVVATSSDFLDLARFDARRGRAEKSRCDEIVAPETLVRQGQDRRSARVGCEITSCRGLAVFDAKGTKNLKSSCMEDFLF